MWMRRSKSVVTTESVPAGGLRLPYLPGLDGLRALAVIGVVLYHAGFAWIPGGFLGVEVFFVISGYLITSLLITEWQGKGGIDLKAFWLRRARRLLPALFVLLLATLAFAVIFLPEEVAGLRRDSAAAMGYFTNWSLILRNQSYFETVGRPSLLKHLWSLAVEEQFYLCWPLIFMGLMGLLRSRRRALWAVLAGAVASWLWMAFLYRPDLDPSRVYYGTDTRAAGLLIGAALAFAWIPARHAAAETSAALSRWLRLRAGLASAALDLAGLAALVALAIFYVRIDEYQPLLYRGGFALVGLATVAAIAVAVQPRARVVPRLLGWGPLRWVGLRSYGIYLWHWPVFQVTRPQLDLPFDGLPLLALRLTVTLILVELSYRLVEIPVRKGALERAWRAWREAQGVRRRWLGLRWMTAAGVMVLIGAVLGDSVVSAQPPAPPAYLLINAVDTVDSTPSPSTPMPALALAVTANARTVTDTTDSTMTTVETGLWSAPLCAVSVTSLFAEPSLTATVTSASDLTQVAALTPARADQRARDSSGPAVPDGADRLASSSRLRATSPDKPRSAGASRPLPALTSPIAPPLASAPVISATTRPVSVTATPVVAHQVTVIGDSVTLGAVSQLEKALGDVGIDAAVGRQVSAAIAILQQRVAAGQLGPVVVIHMGNNGTFSAKQFDTIMGVLNGERRVIFLTARVPRTWEGPNNTVLTEGVKRYPNAVLVDWRSTAADHPEYFWGDGIHLRPEGAQVYADLIAAAVKAP
jgi:peptidoglycan/LPS O-acetylase OafA/YrhL